MGWPQWIVVLWLAFNVLYGVAVTLRNRTLSSGQVTINAMVVVAIYGGLAATLSAGGFW